MEHTMELLEEISRLKWLVREAYIEGMRLDAASYAYSLQQIEQFWGASKSRRELENQK